MAKTITVRAAAHRMGCTLKYIYDLLYSGRLAGARKVGREWRIPEVAVESLLKARRQSNAAARR